MTSDALSRLRHEALQLTATERAELAHDLVASLDAPYDDDAAIAWDREIRNRIGAMNDGTARYVSAEEFLERIKAARRGE